jgi:hypothetical protein
MNQFRELKSLESPAQYVIGERTAGVSKFSARIY